MQCHRAEHRVEPCCAGDCHAMHSHINDFVKCYTFTTVCDNTASWYKKVKCAILLYWSLDRVLISLPMAMSQ